MWFSPQVWDMGTIPGDGAYRRPRVLAGASIPIHRGWFPIF